MDLNGIGIAVFCASSSLAPAPFVATMQGLGRSLACHGATVVYGGASVGLMGAMADAALSAGGRVVGVIPRQLADREIAHTALTELILVDTMHQRKQIMSDRCQAYVIAPGGFGTYDEFLEVVTWRQLGLHAKPIVLLNLEGFYDPLLAQIDHAIDLRLIQPQYRSLLTPVPSVEHVIDALLRHEPVPSEPRPWY